MPVVGKGQRKILVIGEAPGAYEDQQNRPFVGKSGQLLQRTMLKYGVDLFRDCWVTNTLICRPPDNRDPKANELDSCLPSLVKVIRDLQPAVIMLLGRFAITQVISMLWRSDVGTGFRWVGFQIPSVDWNAWVCPMLHPEFIERKSPADSVEGVLWRRHVEAACGLQGRPWAGNPPDYPSMVRTIHSPSQAAAAVHDFMGCGGPVAFDYESDRLKPDHPSARIVSCSVSDGETAVSFPWVGAAIDAMRDLLRSDVPKLAWNMKHEQRWTRAVFGHGVRNWLWDGMIATHVMDNRQGITSLKFQSLVRLGMGSYDETVSPYLRADSGNEQNRIAQADLRELLLYGGMDALFTAKICQQQMEEMG